MLLSPSLGSEHDQVVPCRMSSTLMSRMPDTNLKEAGQHVKHMPSHSCCLLMPEIACAAGVKACPIGTQIGPASHKVWRRHKHPVCPLIGEGRCSDQCFIRAQGDFTLISGQPSAFCNRPLCCMMMIPRSDAVGLPRASKALALGRPGLFCRPV